MNRKLIGAALILSLSLAACSASTPPVVLPDPIVDPVPQADFNFTLTPAVVNVQANGTAALSATLQRSGGFTSAVTLTLLNPPTGISAAAVTVPAGATTAKLDLKASSASVPGEDTLTFAADAGSLHKTVQVKINVAAAPVPVGQAALTLVATPENLTLKAGQPTSLTVKVTRSNVTGPVTLHLSNLPINVTAADVVIPDGQDSAQMTLIQSGKSPAGNSTIQLQASSNAVKTSLNIPLTVESAESLPTAPTVIAADAQVFQGVGLKLNLKFSHEMSADAVKAISVTPAIDSFQCVINDNGSAQSNVLCSGDPQFDTAYTLTVSTAAKDSVGTPLAQPYTFNFKSPPQDAIPDPLPQSLTLSSTPGSLTVKAGSPASLTVKVQRKNVSGPVKLHATNLPVNVTASDVVIPAGQDSAAMTLTQTGNSPAGTSPIQVQATSGNVSASLNVPLTVENPAPAAPIPQVIGTLPNPAQQNVDPAGLGVMVKFSEPMQASAAQAISFFPVVANLKCNVVHDEFEAVYCTGDFAGNTLYNVTMSTAAKTTSGVALAAPYSFSFKTAPFVIILPPFGDLVPPKVTGFTPTNGALGVNHAPLSITVNFNEAMNKVATQNAFELVVPNVTDSKKSFGWNAAGTVMTMTYNEVLPYGTTIIWGMSKAATDLAGNSLAQASSVGGTFRLVRQNTMKLYSDVNSSVFLQYEPDTKQLTKNDPATHLNWIGRYHSDYVDERYYQRAFYQFPLVDLLNSVPKFSSITKINTAVLNVYSLSSQNTPELLGDLDAVNIATPFIFDSGKLWDALPANSGQGLKHIYQVPGPAIGYHTLDITVPFTYNLKNPGISSGMSQWRIQREFDSFLSSQNFSNRTTEITYQGNKDVNKRPHILVTYEYP
ncbi:Ig-like domain-containing protein [Deinococcus alpinitundrae]|uniref:Ig-like domain-containing protein n=1 Tax=Deinococcus alpinitundrae TaxID=468913 RepID=UPI001379C705|nr:Ig-like domain-containing protein [Deinococcus alpinitundrae]